MRWAFQIHLNLMVSVRLWGVGGSVAEHVLNKYKVLSPIPSTKKTIKKGLFWNMGGVVSKGVLKR